jgi:hypothetical protein
LTSRCPWFGLDFAVAKSKASQGALSGSQTGWVAPGPAYTKRLGGLLGREEYLTGDLRRRMTLCRRGAAEVVHCSNDLDETGLQPIQLVSNGCPCGTRAGHEASPSARTLP